ncbi:MAG: hypothetical protein CMJ18_14085 [Phycisphaeraceae bacterium]|nr:hypothetical protein [Phycisphaeraceae bacterium]
MVLTVSPPLLELGLATAVIVARGIDNTQSSPQLIAYRRHTGRRLASHWKKRSISQHPAIREYHRVHELYGVENEPPSPERLIIFARRNRDLAPSTALVDCYNIVSARTLLSIGAHDLDKLSTPITLRACTDEDVFVPMGQTDPQPVAGEFGFVDPERRVICRLDVRQCEHSKATRASRDVAFFLQANAVLSPAALLKGAWLLAEMIERFTGGKAELVDFNDAGPRRSVGGEAMQVTFDQFKAMGLYKATALGAEPLAAAPALSRVAARTSAEVTAIAPTSILPDAIENQQILVAGPLHPLTVGGDRFDHYVMATGAAERTELLEVVAEIPDGQQIY